MKYLKVHIPVFFLLSVLLISCIKDANIEQEGEFNDSRDGKTYQWVKIGNQVWMAENLAYKVDSGGCWAYDNDEIYVTDYGYLYSWETAAIVAPDGWHLPSLSEWTELIGYLGGDETIGLKMKETGTIHWDFPNENSTNESGFTARPGGYLQDDFIGFENDLFYSMGQWGYWWTLTEHNSSEAIFFGLKHDLPSIGSTAISKTHGFSIRCIKN